MRVTGEEAINVLRRFFTLYGFVMVRHYAVHTGRFSATIVNRLKADITNIRTNFVLQIILLYKYFTFS